MRGVEIIVTFSVIVNVYFSDFFSLQLMEYAKASPYLLMVKFGKFRKTELSSLPF
jgi:hypothetical protein